MPALFMALPLLLSATAQAAMPGSAVSAVPSTTSDTITVPARALQDGDGGTEASSETTKKKKKERGLQIETSFRFRRVQLPAAILDAFFTGDRENNGDWPLRPSSDYCQGSPSAPSCGTDRPSIEGFTYGIEMLFKTKNSAAIVWFDYADANITEGYWDDRDEEAPGNANDPFDGDYLVPTRNLGLVMFGVDYQFELPIVKLDKTKQIFGLDFVVGTGLGLAVMVGDFDQWSGEDDVPLGFAGSGFERHDRGLAPDSDKSIPRILPVLDFNLGLKLNFADKVVLRLEGGLHTMVYYGASLGFRF